MGRQQAPLRTAREVSDAPLGDAQAVCDLAGSHADHGVC